MKFDIVRAWKDQTYRENLSAEQRNQLPANPAGEMELGEADLASVYGGDGWGSGGNYHHCNGRGENNGFHGGFDTQRNSHICSIICSHDCQVDILNILDLGMI
jgi:mersacidin/lichenicidin family type 2 lantibiotic